jgi:hypothetical protein
VEDFSSSQTHYGSLTDDFSYHPNIRRMHMQTQVDDERLQVSQPFRVGNTD